MTWIDPRTDGGLPGFQNWENFGAQAGGGGYNVPEYGPQTPIIGWYYVNGQPAPAEPPPLPPPDPIVAPPGREAPPDSVPPIDFGQGPFPPGTPGWPLERLPQPSGPPEPRGGPIRYELGPDWEDIYLRMEGQRYRDRGYDFWEFAEDFGLDPDEAEYYWPPHLGGFVMGQPRRQPQPELPRRPTRRTSPPEVPRRREPLRTRRRLDELFPRRLPIPPPRGDEIAPYPVAPPIPPPPAPPPLEVPAPPAAPEPEVAPVPAPRIPQPEVPERESPTWPNVPAPIPRPLPAPRPAPRLPRRVHPAPRVARWPRVAGPAVSVAAILRRYIVRRPESEPAPRFNFRDVISEPVADPLPFAPPATPLPETALPRVPELVPDLTPLQAAALPFAQLAPQAQECREPETKEEREERRERNASNVVASVRTYRRRMSQNSLDNLR